MTMYSKQSGIKKRNIQKYSYVGVCERGRGCVPHKTINGKRGASNTVYLAPTVEGRKCEQIIPLLIGVMSCIYSSTLEISQSDSLIRRIGEEAI